MTTFPTSLPSDYGMFSTAGNAYMAGLVRHELALRGGFFDEKTAEALATKLTREAAKEPDMGEATDTMVRDLVWSVLTGRTNEFLGLDSVAS